MPPASTRRTLSCSCQRSARGSFAFLDLHTLSPLRRQHNDDAPASASSPAVALTAYRVVTWNVGQQLDALFEAQGGAVAEHWRHAKERVASFLEEKVARNADLDSRPLPELRERALASLEHAAAQLTEAEIVSHLEGHGWTRPFADSMAAECLRLRQCILDGEYKQAWGGSGLGRWMLEEVTPKASDHLKDSVHETQFVLEAYSRRLAK